MIPGVDLSNWQTAGVNWDAVAAAGYQFACIKASEGVTFTDPDFARNWAEAKRVGLVRGAYHFARPSQDSAADEAAYFLARVGTLEAGDLLALDIEDTAVGDTVDLSGWVLAWLQAVEAAVGFKPFLYSGAWFMLPHGLETSAELAQYGLWYASYQATQPATPPVWPFTAIWQNSASATVPGVPGLCDTDRFNGTIDQLRAYGAPAPAPTPPAPVPPIFKPFDLAARLQLISFAANGSGVTDLESWLGQYSDAAVTPPKMASLKRPRDGD